MNDRQQIDTAGLAALLFGFLVGSSLVLPMGIQAKQDSWLALLLGGGASLAVVWLYTALARLFPEQSLVAYSRILLGEWLGRLVGLLYLWYGLHLGALVLRNFGEFLTTSLLPSTPISVCIVTLMLLCAYGVRMGLEPLARASQVMVMLLVVQVAFSTILVAKDVHLENLRPMLEQGPVPVLQAAFGLLSFPFGETVLFALLLPWVRPVGGVKRTVMLTVGAAAIFLAAVHARNVAVLNAHLAGTSRFPSLVVVQFIDVADFLNRLDALIVGNWIVAGFMKVSICLLGTATGLAEWLGGLDYRPLVLPLGAIMAALSILVYDNASAMSAFAAVIWPVYSVPFQILMPLLLLGLAKVCGKPAK
ncbi:MAG TPA: endospore germination permease [Symbiobacteriaceae bacterium]|jgi:spore germination protein KB